MDVLWQILVSVLGDLSFVFAEPIGYQSCVLLVYQSLISPSNFLFSFTITLTRIVNMPSIFDWCLFKAVTCVSSLLQWRNVLYWFFVDGTFCTPCRWDYFVDRTAGQAWLVLRRMRKKNIFCFVSSLYYFISMYVC